MQIQIPSHEKAAIGRHVVFVILVKNEDVSTKVFRRYREFEELNAKLSLDFKPTLNLPGKLWMHSKDSLNLRRNHLEKCLKHYLEVRGSNKILNEFLGVKKARSPKKATVSTSPPLPVKQEVVTTVPSPLLGKIPPTASPVKKTSSTLSNNSASEPTALSIMFIVVSLLVFLKLTIRKKIALFLLGGGGGALWQAWKRAQEQEK